MRNPDLMPLDLFSVSHRSGGERRGVTHSRLRATLRLLFDGRTADDIAWPPGDAALDVDALRTVSSRARSQYMLERVLKHLPGRKQDDDRPLPASAGAPGAAAVALAFRTGLGVDAHTIADILETSPERVGADLFQARRAVDLALPVPCERFTATVSLLSDRALDSDERLQYISHVLHCDRCPAVVEAIARLDAELGAEVDRYEHSLPDAPARRRRGLRLLPVLGAVAMAVVAIVGLATLSGLLSGARDPVPLLVTAAPPQHTGWLIQQSTGGRIEALSLATRDTRSLGAWSESDEWLGNPTLSPDGRRIAFWAAREGTFTLTVAEIGGDLIQELTFDATDSFRYFTGWLGETELLIADSPHGPPGETVEAFHARLANEGRLLAVDVETGAERVVYQGSVAYASVAPDGTRIAIVPPRDQRWPGESLELRHMSDEGVGALIASVEHRKAGAAHWAPDSSALFFSHIADETIETIEFAPGQVFSPTARRYEQAELASLSRDGASSFLWAPETGEHLDVASVSPDGRTVIFQSGTAQTLGYFRYVFFRIPAGGGEPEPFTESPHPNGAWSPDGTTLLWPTVVSWYLTGDATDPAGRIVPDIAFVAFGPDWAPRTVHGEIGPNSVGPRVLGWLPEDALPVATETERPVALRGQAAEPAPVANAGSGNQLVPGSVASPNGQYVTLRAAHGETVIWNTERRRARRLLSGSQGGSWLPSGNGLLAAAIPRAGAAATRLIFYAPQFTRDIDARYDFRPLNPAGLDELGARYYAAPSLSPDQFNASFFVVDPEQQAVSLWVAGWDTSPRQALRWALPHDSLLDVPLQTIWVDNRTLLVAQPDDWRDGLPRRVSLVRVVIDGNSMRVDSLIELTTRPRDLGVALWEMALSPDATQVAYRLRHFGELSNDSGRSDALHVVPVADIGRPIELARGSPGDGIAWSKDSSWLAAGVRGRIALMSVDGRDLTWVTPDGPRADNPLWLSTHELWFSLDTGDGPEIWRVRID
ncbi:MAG TPA: LpqB family beta-propeller domain-containing protein [Thermomicrobiales bacterium]|nr:LpqB family beta-propeller domain-containing protein [Thermomicrobiales bacterium]